MIQIKTILFASLRDFGPKNLREGEIMKVTLEEEFATVDGLLKTLKIPKELTNVIMINGTRVTDLNRELHSDDTLMVFPPIGGGIYVPKKKDLEGNRGRRQ